MVYKDGDSLPEGPDPTLLPEEVQVLACLQPAAPNVLPVCCCENDLLRCGVLGYGHQCCIY